MLQNYGESKVKLVRILKPELMVVVGVFKVELKRYRLGTEVMGFWV